MTGRRTQHSRPNGREYEYVSYLCFRGRYEPEHPKPYMVSERALLPWVKEQAARFRVPGERASRPADEKARADLEAARERLGWAVVDGLISREDAKARAQRIAAQLDALETVESAAFLPQHIDWERWDSSSVNDVLTRIIDHIDLDAGMRPVAIEWRIPAEYLA